MLKVGTDFSGIGSPEAALKRLNIPHKNIFACDIDKFAKASFLELNNPVNFYDDITTRNYKEVEQLDLYVAGFPCQSFSMAGKRGGFNDVRGTLFFNVAEFIKINKPECFILENVKGLLSHDKGRTFQTILDVLSNTGGSVNGQISFDNIDDGLGYHIYYKVLNTKDYGIPQNRERIFIVGFKYWREFTFPKKMPLNITLKDLLEDDVNEKYFISEKRITTLKKNDRSIGFTNPENKKIANCILAGYYKYPTDAEYIVHSLFPRSSKTGKGGTGQLSKSDGTTYCLDTGNNQAIQKQNKIRRLTPLECWRLQGFSDEEFYKAQKVNSDTQLYKQAGNSITVNVMVEIIKKIYLK
jgi:DNA (cytosine-5)-methyltransferase 1